MAEPAPPQQNGTMIAASKMPQIDPFTTAESIVQALQVQDALVLQATLVQLDKRAAALNAKPAPRSSPDLVLDYLARNPRCDGIFTAWDYAHKTNSSPLSTAVLSCLTSLIRLLSTDPFTPSPELIKSLLSTKYAPYLERALNPGRNDVTTSALRLCNVLVGFAGGRFARKLFGAFGWSPKVTTRLYKTRLRTTTAANVLTKPDIRTLLVLLVLSFLSAGDARLKAQVLETKGLLGGIFKGLHDDPEVVVNLVLEVSFREIVEDRRVGLEARRNVFDESCINELVKLYDYPLPAITEESPLAASHPTVSVHRFLYALTNWLSDQIAASPVGRSSGPQKVLSTVLRSLRVTEDPAHRALALYILERSPVLAGQFWQKFPSSLDPRLSSRWISAITFATQVVALPVPGSVSLPPAAGATTATTTTTTIDPVTFAPPSVQSILDTILPPSPPSSTTLSRTWYTKALAHPNALVSFLSSLFLLSILQKATKVLESMMRVAQSLEEGPAGGRWTDAMRRVRDEIKNKVPDVGIVVGLMSRTAAAAASADGGAKKNAKGGGDEAAALLRTNIALRLLYLYHRVVPSLIATLKFDFTKLPQTFANRPSAAAAATTDDDDLGSAGGGGEGLRAISSSYALRLAAVHESGAASFNRPGDHFKSLVPLFALYRVASLTPSNRTLLVQTLERQLATPLLFGHAHRGQVGIWLASLPTPSDASAAAESESDATHEVITWFEKLVHKTLTAPVGGGGGGGKANDDDQRAFSPLMQAAFDSLAAATEPPSRGVQSFVRNLAVAHVAFARSIGESERVYDALKTAWNGHQDATKATLETLSDVLEVVKGKGPTRVEAGGGNPCERLVRLVETGDEAHLAAVTKELNPRRENVFVAFEFDPENLDKILAHMPLAFVCLHARPGDVDRVSRLVPGQSSTAIVAAAQVFLYRFVTATSAQDSEAFATGLAALNDEANVAAKAEIRHRAAARDGLRGLFERSKESEESTAVTTSLIARLFSPSSDDDVELLRPFSMVLVADLASEAEPLAPRVTGSATLLPFFSTDVVLPFAEALLVVVSTHPAPRGESLLAAVFSRLYDVPASAAFEQLWIKHFALIVRASSSAADDRLRSAADRVLAKGSSTLLVSSASTTVSLRRSASTAALPLEEWTATILGHHQGGSELSPAQAAILSALVARSSAARQDFLRHVVRATTTTAAAGFDAVAALEVPLRAVLEVAAVTGEPVDLARPVVEAIVRSVLARDHVGAAGVSVLDLVTAVSPSAATVVRAALEANLAGTDRDGYRASTVAVVGRLAEKDAALEPVLERYVNGAFEGLTRKFVDAHGDDRVEPELSVALRDVIDKHDISLKGHLVEPLVTSIATNRLAQAEPIELAVAICRRLQFKDNEITRHLNEVFASSDFQEYQASASTLQGAALSTVHLVLALAGQSPAAAGNARSVERLVPFYRATLSAFDRSLFDLFLRIERSGTVSLARVLAAWSPSADTTTLLDGTRIGALGAVRKPFVRRSWARAFASSRIAASSAAAAAADDATTYDPRFVVAFTLGLVEEDDLKPQEWTTFLESGALGTVVAALAASDDGLRTMARATLALLSKTVDPLTFRERDEVVLVLSHCRNATFSSAGEPIPAAIALFLAHCAAQLGTPASPLYPAFTRFLLQRSTIDLRDVPMFYTMMYSSKADEWAASPREERGWMVRYLTEGLVRTQDWKIYRRRQVFELVASLFHSSRQDAPLRKLILEFMIRATLIPTAARELLSRNGLVGWIAAQTPLDSTERRLMATILANVARVMSFDKLTGVADLLDTLTRVIGLDLHAVDATSLLDLLNDVLARLPAPVAEVPASPTLVLTLNRISDLLAAVSSSSATAAAIGFYTAAVSLAFVQFEAGVAVTPRDRALWHRAIEVGLEAGVEDLARELLKLQR
ncbi:hypothetical protein JCM11491_004864 [Sporobolomyces phaffii]